MNNKFDFTTMESPVFIVGAPRSGTTLTAKILGRHPEVYAPAPGESHFFEDIWTRQDEFGSLTSEAEVSAAVERVMTLFGRFDDADTQGIVESVINRDELCRQVLARGGGYDVLYMVFTGMLTAAFGKHRFCDDTPKHLFYLDTIYRLFPDAKVVACIRDVRGYLNSYKNWWHKATDAQRIRRLYHPILTTLLWKASSQTIARYVEQHERFSLLRYEDLIKQPEQEIRRVCQFLNIEYTDELLKIESSNSSFEQASQGIYQSSICRWKEDLSPEEIWWAQTLTRNSLLKFGYQMTDVGEISSLKILKQVATFPYASLTALRANRNKRGPTFKYIRQRFSALVR